MRLDLLNILDILIDLGGFFLLFGVPLRGGFGFLDILIDFFIIFVDVFGLLGVPVFVGSVVMAVDGFLVDDGEFGGLGGGLVIEVEELVGVLVGLFGFLGLLGFGVEIVEVELLIPFGHSRVSVVKLV